jgi:hypothetical protein
MPTRRSRSLDLNTPRANYLVFRETLLGLLDQDDSFKAQYLRAEFESKLLDPEFSDAPDKRRSAAINKWLDCEVRNRDTNVRLMHSDETDFLFLNDRGFPISSEDILTKAREFILSLLGDVVPWETLRGSFSGGASTSFKRDVGMIARKYQMGSNITERAIGPFYKLVSTCLWIPHTTAVVPGNVMFTVPKTSVIDRCAAKEPECNMYIQKAVGDFIRRRLLRVGIDLNDQTVNQRLAREGAANDELATIDLSSASDSITRQLVLRLLPDEWFYLMDDIRSPLTDIDGTLHVNEMFSSMGNGFTFELETLIFWALTRACAWFTRIKGRISVYGDDIICPSGLEESLLQVLDFCGFKVNTKKSHFHGPFRESCGSHWFSEHEVTPFYVKEIPMDVSGWILLCNSLRRWARVDDICDPRYYELWKLAASNVPKPFWGGWDLSTRNILCAPGRLPLAALTFKQKRHRRLERELAHGAYIHWLDTRDCSTTQPSLSTSVMSYDGPLSVGRVKWTRSRDIPLFPQELGVN